MPPLDGAAKNIIEVHNYIPCPMQRHQKFAKNGMLYTGFDAHNLTNFDPFVTLHYIYRFDMVVCPYTKRYPINLI